MHQQITTPAPAPLPEKSVGATIVYVDKGVYGFIEKRQRVGVIVSEKYCRFTGQTYLVKTEGFNLPHLVHESDIIGFCHPSLTETKTTVETAVFA